MFAPLLDLAADMWGWVFQALIGMANGYLFVRWWFKNREIDDERCWVNAMVALYTSPTVKVDKKALVDVDGTVTFVQSDGSRITVTSTNATELTFKGTP
jgi:hypothetical protein